MKVYILVARWLGGSSVGFRVYRTMKVYILVARWLGSSSVDFRVYRTKKVYDLVARQLVSEYRAAEPLEVILVRFDYRAAEPFDANISSKVALHSEMRAIYQVNAGILAGFLKGRGDAQSASHEACEADVRGAQKHARHSEISKRGGGEEGSGFEKN